MKISGRRLRQSNFGPLTFAPVNDDTSHDDGFVLSVGGTRIGTMAPLNLDHEEVVLVGDDDGYAVRGAGCWSLDIAGATSADARRHVLWVAAERESPFLAGELAVWATITTLQAMMGHPVYRG